MASASSLPVVIDPTSMRTKALEFSGLAASISIAASNFLNLPGTGTPICRMLRSIALSCTSMTRGAACVPRDANARQLDNTSFLNMFD